MTVVEAIAQAEEIIGSIPVAGRENVKKVNMVFEILDASIAALTAPPKEAQPEPKQAG